MMLPGPTPTAGEHPAACPIKHDRCYPSILNHLCTMFPCASERGLSPHPNLASAQKRWAAPASDHEHYLLVCIGLLPLIIMEAWPACANEAWRLLPCILHHHHNVTSLAFANEQRRFSPTPSRHQHQVASTTIRVNDHEQYWLLPPHPMTSIRVSSEVPNDAVVPNKWPQKTATANC